jgi:hypothetical protein
MLRYVLMASALVFGLNGELFAAELSMTSGLLKTESAKVNGAKLGSKTTIELGARYGDLLGDDVHWFGHGELSINSFDAESGQPAPSNSTGIELGGGMRYHFVQFSEAVVPYLLGGGSFVNKKSARLGTVAGTESNGLYYGASFGFRFILGDGIFAELENELFESALFANEEVNDGTNKTEYTRFDLFATTAKESAPVKINIGMSF